MEYDGPYAIFVCKNCGIAIALEPGQLPTGHDPKKCKAHQRVDTATEQSMIKILLNYRAQYAN